MKTTELEKLQAEFEEKKAELAITEQYESKTGVAPHYVSTLFGKISLSFKVDNMPHAWQVWEAFKKDAVNFTIRTAGDKKETAAPLCIEFKTWPHSRETEVQIKFETPTEYVSIKLPFHIYKYVQMSFVEYALEGEQLELAKYRREPKFYQAPYLPGFARLKFYGGGVDVYANEPEQAEALETAIFQLNTGWKVD